MTDVPPDYRALAQRYLDLWQQQVAKLARDSTQLGGAVEAWSKMAGAMMQSARGHESDATRASPTASSHDAGGMDSADGLRRDNSRLDDIERRLARIEAALAQLAGRAKPAVKSAAAKPRPRAAGGGRRKKA